MDLKKNVQKLRISSMECTSADKKTKKEKESKGDSERQQKLSTLTCRINTKI